MMPRIIFLTGVSSGLGLALAKAFLEAGDRVYGISRREPETLSRHPDFHFASVDLSRLDAIAPAVERLLRPEGRLDIAILNAAALGEIADMAETSLETLKGNMDVNLWANKELLDAVLEGPDGRREVAQVVAVSSGAAVSGARGWNGYAISKAALNMMIKLYAAERPETHFTSLAPGLVDTAMQERMRALPADARFPTLDRLKRAAGTEDMPDPDTAAARILAILGSLASRKSGEFLDLRSLH